MLDTVQADRPLQDPRIAAEFLLPEPVGEDRHPVLSGALLVREEGASQGRLDAEDLEEARRGAPGVEADGRPPSGEARMDLVSAGDGRE